MKSYPLYTALMVSRIGLDKVAEQLYKDQGYDTPENSFFKTAASVIGTDIVRTHLEDRAIVDGLESLEILLRD